MNKPNNTDEAAKGTISVRADQEEVPVIEIGDLGNDDLVFPVRKDKKPVAGSRIVSELPERVRRPTGSSIVLVSSGGEKNRSGGAKRKKKKKKKIRPSLVILAVAITVAVFILALPKAGPQYVPPAPVNTAATAPAQNRIPTDNTGQPLILSGVPTPEMGGRPVQVLAYLDIENCASCMAPFAILRNWWVQDSARRSLRVIIVGQDSVSANRAKAMGVTSWPAVFLRGPDGVRTMSGEGVLEDVFDSTRVVDKSAERRGVMGPPGKIIEDPEPVILPAPERKEAPSGGR